MGELGLDYRHRRTRRFFGAHLRPAIVPEVHRAKRISQVETRGSAGNEMTVRSLGEAERVYGEGIYNLIPKKKKER